MVNDEEVCKMYKEGASSIQIAKTMNKSSSGIRLILRRNNVTIRTQSEANKISSSVKRGITHFNWSGGFSFHKGQVYRNLNHRRVKESHYKWCIANSMGCVPVGMIIHHIDCNSINNNPENLVLLDQSTHAKLHAAIEDERFKNYLVNHGGG